MKKINADTIIGAGMTVLGVATVAYTKTQPKLAFMPQTSDGVPGAGFFPIIFSVFLAVLGLILVITSLKSKGSVKEESISEEESKQNIKQMMLTIGAMVVFFILWQVTKRIIPSFIPLAAVLVFVLNLIYERPLKFNIIYTVVFVALIYVAFVWGFSIQFNM